MNDANDQNALLECNVRSSIELDDLTDPWFVCSALSKCIDPFGRNFKIDLPLDLLCLSISHYSNLAPHLNVLS